MGASRGIYRVLVGNPRERDHFRALVRFPVFLSLAVGHITQMGTEWSSQVCKEYSILKNSVLTA